MMKKGQAKVIIPKSLNPQPSEEELSVAQILTEYFDANVYFIKRLNIKTPDFLISDMQWELKSPRGNSSKTIENILRQASKQSRYVILYLARTRMPYSKVIANVKKYFSFNTRDIDRVIIITKNKKIVDINRKH